MATIKNKDDSLFLFLDWITKKSNLHIKDYVPSLFLINRWLSMANESYCHILNLTTNKWSNVVKNFDYPSFYRKVLPKHTKKINYIKKIIKESESNEEISILSNKFECSKREIEMFIKTLEELNNKTN